MIKLQILTILVLNSYAAGFQIKRRPEYNFFRAAAIGDVGEVQNQLLQVGIDTKSRSGQTALMYAAAAGRKEIVDFLLAKGANSNIQDSVGSTALTLAAQENNSSIMMSLIAARANPNLPNTHGDNALHVAAEHGHLNAIRVLQGNGALHCVNNAGRTPLHEAAFYGHSSVITDLANIRHINQRTNDRFNVTALEIAAFRNHFKCVQALIAQKGHCYFSVSGALRAAILKGNEQMITALQHYETQDEIQNQAVMVTSTPIDWQNPFLLSCSGLQQMLQHQESDLLIPQTRQQLTGYIDLNNGVVAAAQVLDRDSRAVLLRKIVDRLNDECSITLQPLVVQRQSACQLLKTLTPESAIALPNKVSFTGTDLKELIEK
jgi:ankyrin repeat protein